MPDTEFLFRNYLNDARESIFKAMRVHDQADHGGQSCVNERVNTIAWLAHALGLSADNVQQIGELLSDYDKKHAEHNHSSAQISSGN